MKKIRMRVIALVLVAILMPLGYAMAPLYYFFAEDYPVLRGPWGWIEVPDTAPYTEGAVDPAYRQAADKAQGILSARRATIHAPALSAAVAVDGHLVWSAAVGWADIKAGKKATPETLFRIGSTSKAVTGTLFARLVDAGVIDMEAPIATYMDNLPNAEWGPLTARQLASHTAGIPGYEENRDWMGVYRSLALRDHHDNVVEGLDYFDDSPLIYKPGTDFKYSSFDIVLLSAVLQAAGGAPFQALMKKWVNRPLGITTPIPDAPVPERAEPYLLNGAKVQHWWKADLSHKLAGGGFMAKPADLARLGIAWLDEDFISARTRQRFWTPQRLADGSVNWQRYALNWRFNAVLCCPKIPLANANHGGVSKGAMAWLVVIPEKHMAIAMAINTRVLPFFKWAGVQTDLVAAFSQP